MRIPRVNIGLRIEQRLNELSMSKSEFGRIIGIPQQNVNRILEKTSIDTDRLIDISEALNYNFFSEFSPAVIISADNGGIAAGDNSHIQGNTTVGGNINNYGVDNSDGKPSQIVATLTESVATLTRELEISQEQKSRLIGIIEKLTQ